jgi:uncharacterized cupin superfamily protein
LILLIRQIRVKGVSWAGHSTAEEFVGAVQGEILLRRPVGGVCGEGDFSGFQAGEEVGGLAVVNVMQ